jgi:2-alkyl-3-oxoalkanoate reductase
MTSLVTGSAGFLGSAVVERLLLTGSRSIRCFVRPSGNTDRLTRLRNEHGRGSLELFAGNLTSRADVRRGLTGVDTVYHLAASMRGWAAADMFLNTVVGSQRLLDGILESGVRRVVLVSSLSVYGLADVAPVTLIDENTQLEQHPEKRDVYAHTKLRQEELFWQCRRKSDFELIVLRPGNLYGRSGPDFSPRIGLALPGLLLHLGGNNLLPLSYVENCADAVVLAGTCSAVREGAYNVVDDDLPTASQYVRLYQREVRRIRCLRLPFFATKVLSAIAEQYYVYSKGQVPRVLTPYRTVNIWRGHQFDNRKLRSVGWKQRVPTEDGLRRAFAELRARYARTCSHVPALDIQPDGGLTPRPSGALRNAARSPVLADINGHWIASSALPREQQPSG